jgi:ATP-dependent exoDNAse (exonuclease V) beta subunit
MIDTFSSNSLKILDKNLDEFIDKYIHHLTIYKKDDRANLGSQYHALICQYLRGYDISKMKLELKNPDNFDKFLKTLNKNNFIKTEYSFLIKEESNKKPYYLTGRYDAIYKENNSFIIYDWKTLNIPSDIQNDLQTVVYLYTASKIFNTEDIKMRYVSIEKGEYEDVKFLSNEKYKKRIDEIVGKYYNSL